MDMSDNKDSYEREEIGNNYEVKVSDVIEELKVGKLSSHYYVDNVETEPDKINQVDIIDDKDSTLRYKISRNYEEKLTDVDEE